MTSDRELLELAAKAAGAEASPRLQSDGTFRTWNPLVDDRDAFRLTVVLRLSVMCAEVHPNKPEVGYWDGYEWKYVVVEGDEPYAATRRAIVRAAAEIGKGMK